MKPQPPRTFIFSGGGTLGSVTPLIAVAETVREQLPDTKIVWVGTKSGPEWTILNGVCDTDIHLHGAKLRRYLSARTLSAPLFFAVDFIRSFFLLARIRPALCVSAGGYVSVPLHIAAWILRVPAWVHQLDIAPGLANKIMARLAQSVTVSTEASGGLLGRIPEALGTPVRKAFSARGQKTPLAWLSEDLPLLLVIGGGTGAESLNRDLLEILPALDGLCQVVHITGALRYEKQGVREASGKYLWYHQFDFLSDELPAISARAELVVSRAGIGALSEFSVLKKAVISVPKKGHQEKNAQWLAEKEATVLVQDGNSRELEEALLLLLADAASRRRMADNLARALPVADEKSVIAVIRKTARL